MAEAPRMITVVVPVYNRADIVGLTLRSLAVQELKGFDVVLVDNASTDMSKAVLERWKDEMVTERPDIRVTVVSCAAAGAANARNAGLEKVVTPWTLFFDSDDEMLPGHLKSVAEAVGCDPEPCDVVGFDVYVCREGEIVGKQLFNRRGSLMFNQLMHCVLSTQRMAVATDFVRTAGGWNGFLTGWDDYELGVRLLLRGAKVRAIHGEPLVKVHTHPDSITGVGFSHGAPKWEAAADCVEKQLRQAGVSDYLPYIYAVRATLAGHYLREGAVADYRRIRDRLRGAGLSLWQRLVMNAIIAAVRVIGHGGGFISRIAFGG